MLFLGGAKSMKRLILWTFLLCLGAGLGAGGLYVGMNWDRFNPFRNKGQIAAQSVLAQLRHACATETALKGAYVKSADITDGKLNLRGFTASKEQIAALQTTSQALFDEFPDLKAQCANGLAIGEMKVISLHDRLAIWQREFEEYQGAENDVGDNPLKREIMRTTRLDGMAFKEDGTLVLSGVCIRGDKKPETTRKILGDLLLIRLAEAGVTPELMPELALDVLCMANPAVTVQNSLAKVPEANGVYVVSAWYNKKGELNLDAIIRHGEQRKLIDDAIRVFLDDPKYLDMLRSPSDPTAEPTLSLTEPFIVEGEAKTRALQKKLMEYARKENKPFLRQVRLADILPTAVVDEKKEIVTDEEGNPRYYFRVKGRLLETAAERKKIEDELIAWIVGELPRLTNPDQSPIMPKLDVTARPSPVIALQDRIVQRGLDGAVITDALFDEEGKLEISGRLHQPGDAEKQTLEVAIKDLLVDEAPWTLSALKPHASSKDGQPIAWADAVRECQAKLAKDNALGRRVRLDRLYFTYDNTQLMLVGKGVFLADAVGENPTAALAKSIDAVIVTRGKADVSTSNVRTIKNPLAELQNLLTQRADLDGAVLTQARYDADGRLIFDGYLGQAEQKAALAPLLAGKLAANADLLKTMADLKATAWSIEALKPHASAKGEWKWPEVIRACQGELAADAPFQRTCLERAFFQYVEAKTGAPPRLTLHCKAVALTKPKEKIDAAALAQKFDALGKRLLPDVKFTLVETDLHQAETPIYELQKLAVAKRHDGFLFADAFYAADGKLTFDGLRGGDKETKDVQQMIEQFLAKDKSSLAPGGVADLGKLKLSPWSAVLEDVRMNLANDAAALAKQTRIDRAFFQYGDAGSKAQIVFQGVCIYQGKTPMPDDVPAAACRPIEKAASSERHRRLRPGSRRDREEGEPGARHAEEGNRLRFRRRRLQPDRLRRQGGLLREAAVGAGGPGGEYSQADRRGGEGASVFGGDSAEIAEAYGSASIPLANVVK